MEKLKKIVFAFIMTLGFFICSYTVFAVSDSRTGIGFWQSGDSYKMSGKMEKMYNSYFIPTSNLSGTNRIATNIYYISIFGWHEKASNYQNVSTSSLGQKISIYWEANSKNNTGFEWEKVNGSLANGGGAMVATVGFNDR